MARNVQIQVLRGLLANIPALAIGELYLATDTKQVYVGTSSGNQVVGSSSNTVTGIVDFGVPEPTEDTTARVTVSATWVTAGSVLQCSVVEGQDHTDDEVAAEQVTVTVGNIQPGVGFDIVMSAPNGASRKFLVNVRG